MAARSLPQQHSALAGEARWVKLVLEALAWLVAFAGAVAIVLYLWSAYRDLGMAGYEGYVPDPTPMFIAAAITLAATVTSVLVLKIAAIVTGHVWLTHREKAGAAEPVAAPATASFEKVEVFA